MRTKAIESPRQELGIYAGTGRLRQDCESHLSTEAVDLLVTIVLRYCEPRKPALYKRLGMSRKQLGEA